MTAGELIEKLRAFDPSARVLMTTTYLVDDGDGHMDEMTRDVDIAGVRGDSQLSTAIVWIELGTAAR